MRYFIFLALSLFILVATFLVIKPKSRNLAVKSDEVATHIDEAPHKPKITRLAEADLDREKANKLHVDDESVASSFDKEMAEFEILSQKALRTRAEQSTYGQLLGRRDWQLHLVSVLHNYNEMKFSKDKEQERMKAIAAIAEILKYTPSSDHRELLDDLEAIILDQGYLNISDRLLIKSLIGDKIELLVLLYRKHPERVLEVQRNWINREDEVSDYVMRTAKNLARVTE